MDFNVKMIVIFVMTKYIVYFFLITEKSILGLSGQF